jgi:hypothetical protein
MDLRNYDDQVTMTNTLWMVRIRFAILHSGIYKWMEISRHVCQSYTRKMVSIPLSSPFQIVYIQRKELCLFVCLSVWFLAAARTIFQLFFFQCPNNSLYLFTCVHYIIYIHINKAGEIKVCMYDDKITNKWKNVYKSIENTVNSFHVCFKMIEFDILRLLEILSTNDKIITPLYDKRDDFNISIVNFLTYVVIFQLHVHM